MIESSKYIKIFGNKTLIVVINELRTVHLWIKIPFLFLVFLKIILSKLSPPLFYHLTVARKLEATMTKEKILLKVQICVL